MFDENILNQGNKRKSAQIVLRVLKECKVINEFYAYLKTSTYNEYAKCYAENNNTSRLWYDRRKYSNILGCCDFDSFLKRNGKQLQPYYLVLIYIAIFEEELYHEEKCINYHYDAALFVFKESKYLTEESLKIVQRWKKIKKIKDKLLKKDKMRN